MRRVVKAARDWQRAREAVFNSDVRDDRPAGMRLRTAETELCVALNAIDAPPPKPEEPGVRCCNSSHEPPDTACRTFAAGLNGRCVFCDHEQLCHPGPGATCDIGGGETGAYADLRLAAEELRQALVSPLVTLPRETLERFIANAIQRDEELETECAELRAKDKGTWRRAQTAALVRLYGVAQDIEGRRTPYRPPGEEKKL